jgi:hypothetical protein
MKSVLLPASLLAALCLVLPVQALAQAPEQPPPAENPRTPPPVENPRTPPPREYAVPRAEAPRPETIVVREPQSDTGAPREQNSTADQGNRRRPPATASRESPPPPAPSTASSSSESSDQGAQRRGAVRRPPSDTNAGRGQVSRDRAVARSSVPPRDRDVDIYYYPDYWSYGRYYSPYYATGFHLGYLAYSPWGWTPAFYGYPYGWYGYGSHGYQHGYDLGSLKIKVTPRDAEVYVDGYFAGHVDDFDGFWQSLKLDSGGYRIEIRKPGFETLQFDVQLQPDRTITYRGELRPTP